MNQVSDRRTREVVFPMPALVALEDLCRALLLSAVDPGIGGVLVRGEKGSGKTTAARGLSKLLPGDAPFVELPLGATEDRVVGSFDIRAALSGDGYRFQPGLLAAAHGGVLYVDEVNLLPDHLVDVLLDVAVSGVNRVERDGVSHVHPSRFVLVGSMNPEEGELRPQLLDRFGLSVVVAAPTEPSARAEALRRRLAFEADPVGFTERWAEELSGWRERLERVVPAPLESGTEEQVAVLCAAAGAEGLRADLVICRAAAALAGWEERPTAGTGEVRLVAPLALAHRRRTAWEAPGAGGVDLDAVLDEALQPGPSAGARSETDGGASTAVAREAGSEHDSDHDEMTGSAGEGGGASEPPAAEQPSPREPLPPRSVSRPTGTVESQKGRFVRAREPEPGQSPTSIAPGATVAAAARRVVSETPGTSATTQGISPSAEDLREAVRRQPVANLVVFAVDASGSMGATTRLAAARDGVMSLLADAYVRRDRVALVTFRGEGSDVVLRPTGSTEVARARLESLPTGGRTPLAQGILTGLKTALNQAAKERSGRCRPLLVVVTDGRATWASGGEDPVRAALRAGAEVRRAGIDAVVVDCELDGADSLRRRPHLGVARSVADAMGAAHVPLHAVTGEGLSRAVVEVLASR